MEDPINNIIKTFPVNETIAVEDLAEWTQAGWAYVGTFVFTEDVQTIQIARPGQPDVPVMPRHVFVRPPGLVSTTVVMSTIMGVAEAFGDNEEVEKALDAVLHNLTGQTIEGFRKRAAQYRAMQKEQGGMLQ